MKTTILLFLAITAGAFAATDINSVLNPESSSLVETLAKKITIQNDTGEKVKIHTGKGVVSLNKGAKTHVHVEVGHKIYLEKDGKKGALIFTVTADMLEGKVLLSDYL